MRGGNNEPRGGSSLLLNKNNNNLNEVSCTGKKQLQMLGLFAPVNTYPTYLSSEHRRARRSRAGHLVVKVVKPTH